MQFVRMMAATGMGNDTPPSIHLQALAASPAFETEEAEKSEYAADDEGEDDEEVDFCFDYVPPSEDSATEDGSANQVLPTGIPAITTADMMEEATQTTDVAAVEELEVEHHTTTVVKKYLHSVGEEVLCEASGEMQQENSLMAVTQNSSSSVIDRVSSSMLQVGGTEGLLSSTTTHRTYAEVGKDEDMEKSEVEGLLDGLEGVAGSGEEDKRDSSMELSSTEEQPQLLQSPMVDDSMVDDVAVNERPSDGDEVPLKETPRESTQGDDEPGKNQNLASSTNQEAQPAKTKIVASPLPLLLSSTSSPAAKAEKRKLSSAFEDETGVDTNGSPSTTPRKKTPVAPSHTPKQTKRAASKKQQKKSPCTTQTSAPEELQPIRRSTRVKQEPPKFTYPVKRLADATVMSHFKRSAGKDVMTCKYCSKEMTASRSSAQTHLKECSKIANQEHSAVQEDDTEEKPAVSSLSAVKADADVKMEIPAHESSCVSLVHLMGLKTLAGKVKGAFQNAAFTGHAPISRFQDLIRDDVTGLRHLRVQELLDAVDPVDGQAVLLHVKSAGGRRRTGQENVDPVSKAKARDMENCSLRFPAPHNVAKEFIVPLATELGLDYMMHRHTAKIVSCPEQGAVLDWRCHRTEMVVFQLGGIALWKMRVGPVHTPQSCYYPDSWLLDSAVEVDKVHRASTMKKHALGSLTPPFDELHVFDENPSSGEVEKLQEHMLMPGSVAYVPAGTWFETETKENNVLWLEVQLEGMTYETLLLAAVKQLSWQNMAMCKKMQLYPNRGVAKGVRHHMESCMKALRDGIDLLDSSDLVPEYLVTTDLNDLRAQGLIHDTSSSSASTSFEVDLTNPRFKLKHVKVFKDVAYRVNPVAVLRSVDEIAHLKEEDQAPASVASATTHRALKKSPKPKRKRKHGLRVITHTGKHTYVLDEVFGNDAFSSQLHVKFQCSAEQSRLIEWLRSRDAELFGVAELTRGDDSVSSQSKSSGRCEETARNLLRFLCFVGYVSQVKSPKQTPVQRQLTNEAA